MTTDMYALCLYIPRTKRYTDLMLYMFMLIVLTIDTVKKKTKYYIKTNRGYYKAPWCIHHYVLYVYMLICLHILLYMDVWLNTFMLLSQMY